MCEGTEVVEDVIVILWLAFALITTSPTASKVASCPTLTEATTCLLELSLILSAVAISLTLPSPVITPSVKVTLPLLSTCACNF